MAIIKKGNLAQVKDIKSNGCLAPNFIIIDDQAILLDPIPKKVLAAATLVTTATGYRIFERLKPIEVEIPINKGKRIAVADVPEVNSPKIAATTQEININSFGLSLNLTTKCCTFSKILVLVIPAPITNIPANIITLILIKPLKAR